MRTQTLTFKRAKRLRRSLTPQELGLWVRLKNRKLGGFKFRCQHPIGPYILDFYCAEGWRSKSMGKAIGRPNRPPTTRGATPISGGWGSRH